MHWLRTGQRRCRWVSYETGDTGIAQTYVTEIANPARKCMVSSVNGQPGLLVPFGTRNLFHYLLRAPCGYGRGLLSCHVSGVPLLSFAAAMASDAAAIGDDLTFEMGLDFGPRSAPRSDLP
jgi:hypothetical protein